jgi:hypothetical protein
MVSEHGGPPALAGVRKYDLKGKTARRTELGR